jgi:HAD superfamily hydrolase (TIGR01484 family)
MLPIPDSIENLPRERAALLNGVLFDLDDTFLDHGSLREDAYCALFRLRESGLRLCAVTGRPHGWGVIAARQWPVDGVVAENGAIAAYREAGRVLTQDPVPPHERAARRAQLKEVATALRERFPELEFADDVGARVTDLAFDIAEYQRVSEATVLGALAYLAERGVRAWTSSVHLHLTLDADDKASGALRLIHERFGIGEAEARETFAYLGDSENDASCFRAFETSIGVANLSPRLSVSPRYRTAAPRGAGFAEAASVVVRLRRP